MSRKTKQNGFTLIELMIAMALSVVVVGGMVAMMANTLGTSTATINSTRLNDELRLSMQIMSRDLRRAGYFPDTVNVIGTNTGLADYQQIQTFDQFGSDGVDDCIIFGLDRDPNTANEASDWSGFRLVQDANGIGVVEIKVAGAQGDASCTAGTWLPISDPNVADITALNFDDSNSYGIGIPSSTGTGTSSTIQVRKYDITLQGNLTGNPGVGREITQEIRVRNDRFDPA